MPESGVTKMKVADLKRELKLRGLATTGNKTELQDRLQTALLDGDISFEDSALTNEDELLDEDAVLTDEEDSPIAADENELLKSPTSTPTASELASPLNENKGLTDVTVPPINPKKIILKRKATDAEKTTDTTESVTASTTAKENTEPPKDKVLKMSERNPITVSDLKPPNTQANNGTKANEAAGGKKVVQLSQMERLELRAKKFGLGKNSSTEAKPTSNTKISSGTEGPVVNDAKQIEILKKRAERFGCVVSSKIAQIDAAEKLQKRKERFGAGSAIAAGATVEAAPTNNVWAEKARARLERFKNTPTSGKKVTASPSSEDTANTEAMKVPEPLVASSPPPTTIASN